MTLSYLLQPLVSFLPFFLPPISTLNIPDLNQTSETYEGPVVHVTEYSTALINVSWVDSKRGILHTDTSETGRFSSAGATTISGVLAVARSQPDPSSPSSDPQFGCTAPLHFSKGELLEAPRIALIRRGGCVFDKKVENAEAAGAAGVVIYNDRMEEHLRTIAVSHTSIPVVFTYQWKGKELVDLVEEGKTVFISLEEGSHCQQGDGNSSAFFTCVRTKNYPDLDLVYNHRDPFNQDTRIVDEEGIEHSWAVVFVSISFLILMMLSLGWLLFYYVYRIRTIHAKDAWERRVGRQARKALNSVDLLVVDEREEERECMVCLDMLQQGEEVRCLPCRHTFHRKCIDDWLLTKRKCPLCNLNIVHHFGLGDNQDTDMESDQSDMVHYNMS
eukprot:GFUD01014567.1.p1 GENE.GFUD01014567.1~~GFUD01014567.1.p1  ORF type:complete len:387 (-),score=104.31 GFUD01014567.1:324-1484(-)